jgi:DNA-directed RNA polymerase subunit RPC12/RpoP
MGLILDARCDACGYGRDGLRLGATHAQIAAHDRSHHEVFAAPCCREVQSVEVVLGAPWPEPPCAGCGRPFTLVTERRYRISTMKGEVLSGHACPRCDARSLRFERAGTFI